MGEGENALAVGWTMGRVGAVAGRDGGGKIGGSGLRRSWAEGRMGRGD